MRKREIFFLLIVWMAVPGVDVSGQIPMVGPKVETLTLEPPGGPPIYYSRWTPENYVPSRPIPLVLALHFGGNPEGAGRALLEILVAQALPDLGAVIVAPDSKGRGWTNAENERAVNLLLEDVMKTYNIDKKKIVVTGFSMGGAGAWHFGLKYPELFSAVIPIAGTPQGPPTEWQLPVLAIHSVDDTVVPIGRTQTYIAELRKRGVRAELIEVKGIAHHQTYRFVESLRRAVPWLKELWKQE